MTNETETVPGGPWHKVWGDTGFEWCNCTDGLAHELQESATSLTVDDIAASLNRLAAATEALRKIGNTRNNSRYDYDIDDLERFAQDALALLDQQPIRAEGEG